MKDTRQKQGASGGAAAIFASGMLIIVVAVMLTPALAAVPPGRDTAQEQPRLASLQIEIWPEFDRPAALVMLKGEFAGDPALLPTASIRIPASSGGPAAVAFATAAKGDLFNLKYDRTDAKDFITLRFKTPQRFFHVEFYDPLVTSMPDRIYTYVWPGDLAVDRLSVHLQDPTSASNFSVRPNLSAGVAGPEGLLYWTAELGAREGGKQLPIEIRYTKTDERTSSDILGLKIPDSAPVTTGGTRAALPDWLLALAILAGVVGVAGIAGSLWWRRRGKTFRAQPGGAGFCPQCGSRLAAGRFCSACGAPIREN